MKEKWNEIQTSLEEMTLMVIGMLISPRKFTMIGNNNGNNNGNNEGNYDETEE